MFEQSVSYNYHHYYYHKDNSNNNNTDHDYIYADNYTLLRSSNDYANSNDEAKNSSMTATTTTTTTTRLHRWTEFLEIHGPTALLIDRAVTPLWYAIGLAGNLISAVIWTRLRSRAENSSAVYLAALSIGDLIFIVLHPLQELQYAWSVPVLQAPVLCEAYFVLYLFSQYLSPSLVLGFTAERYVAVCHPFRKRVLCGNGRAAQAVAATVAGCFVVSSAQAYFWTFDADSGECRVRTDTVSIPGGGSTSLWSAWTWTSEMVIFLAVPLTILTLNLLVIRELRTVARKKESWRRYDHPSYSSSSSAATTAMLLSVSFYVIVTSLPATFVYALESSFPFGRLDIADSEVASDPTWARFFAYLTTRKVIEEACLSHYACNFFVFVTTGRQFRSAFIEMLKKSTVSLRKTKELDEYVEVATTH